MGDVILMDKHRDFKDCSYFNTHDNYIGLKMRDGGFDIVRGKENIFTVCVCGIESTYTRESLAEFIHVAKCLIDDEDRWMPNVDLVAHNYEND